MSDLEKDLRADGRAWREQVDAVRPDVAPTPGRPRARVYLAGLAAAAVVVALAVVVLVLRHPSSSSGGHIAAGAEQASSASVASSSPASVGTSPLPTIGPAPVRRVPQQADCPLGSSGSGFAASIAANAHGYPSPEAAAEHSGYGNPHAPWQVADRDQKAALLLQRWVYLHAIRLPDGSWLIDTGGTCGGGNATVAK
jgi:hypothetical protein